MNFKVGDIVIVSNPDAAYAQYRNMTGVIIRILDYYIVRFDIPHPSTDIEAFNGHEIELAKNTIIYNIIREL